MSTGCEWAHFAYLRDHHSPDQTAFLTDFFFFYEDTALAHTLIKLTVALLCGSRRNHHHPRRQIRFREFHFVPSLKTENLLPEKVVIGPLHARAIYSPACRAGAHSTEMVFVIRCFRGSLLSERHQVPTRYYKLARAYGPFEVSGRKLCATSSLLACDEVSRQPQSPSTRTPNEENHAGDLRVGQFAKIHAHDSNESHTRARHPVQKQAKLARKFSPSRFQVAFKSALYPIATNIPSASRMTRMIFRVGVGWNTPVSPVPYLKTKLHYGSRVRKYQSLAPVPQESACPKGVASRNP